MKRLMFIALLITGNLLCESTHKIHVYKNISKKAYSNDGDDAYLQLMFICAILSARYTHYSFKTFKFNHVIVFNASNHDCWLSMKFNRKTHTCQIDFNALDDSFDYDRFIAIIDSLF